MANPFKHPKTGVYWFRKAVPMGLRGLVGKTEINITLGTKDFNEAVPRFLKVAVEVQHQWEALVDQRPPMTEKQVAALAGEFYRWVVEKDGDNPGRPEKWQEALAQIERAKKRVVGGPSRAMSIYLPKVEEFAAERKIVIHQNDLWSVALAAIRADADAKTTLLRRAQGDWSEPPGPRYPDWEEAKREIAAQQKKFTLANSWEAFRNERELSDGTVKRWRPVLAKLAVFAGSDDLSKVTKKIFNDWKDALLAEGLSPKTVKEVHVAAARNFFQWAVKNDRLLSNPASDVEVRLPKNYQPDQGRAFEDHEVHLILSESLRPASKRTTACFASALRWVPWLCAYTGARVNEMTQLRGVDVTLRDVKGEEVWVIRITPEAGNTKTNTKREVPLHPHLVEQGFPKYAQERGEGPLFYDPKLARGGSRANPQYAKVGSKIGDWVRDIGVKDPEVQPNHGWRHTFQQIALSARLDPETRDAIKGHAPRTEGEKYGGNPPMDAKWREMQLFPRFPFVPPTGPAPKLRSHAKKVVPAGAEAPKPGRPLRRRKVLAEAAE